MPFADLPGVQLWYEDSGGSGVPVVFLHPASGTTECWAPQIAAFAGAGYRCIAYDRRFWGRSRMLSSGEQPGTAVDDLHALASYLNLERFHVVGTAAGGGPALEYALTHPDRLRSVVVADCGGGVQDAEYVEVQRRLRAPEISALPIELRELSAGYRGTNPDGVRRWIEIERRSRSAAAVGSEEGQRQQTRTPVTLAALERLDLPALALAGDADLVQPPAQMRIFASRIPNCQFALVPEAGHAAHWEQPETWNGIVLDFLSRN